MFDNCSKATIFVYTFGDCPLVELPEDLFKDCIEAVDFNSCFTNCMTLRVIPENLFANCPKVTDFSYCFRNAQSLIKMCIRDRCSTRILPDKTEIDSFSDVFKSNVSFSFVGDSIPDLCQPLCSFYRSPLIYFKESSNVLRLAVKRRTAIASNMIPKNFRMTYTPLLPITRCT